MLLSIIIPVYNVYKFLPKCLNSIVNQIKPDVEIILLDDGSTDNSSKICDLYKQKYNFIDVIHKKNTGVSDTRNLGIQKAKGKYIFFVDGDDWITDNAINCILDILSDDQEVDVIIGGNINYYDDKKKTEDNVHNFLDDIVKQKTGEPLFQYLLSSGTYEWYSVLHIVRKSMLLKYSLFFDTKMVFGEDAIWVPQVLLKSKKNRYIDTPIYVYRRNRKGAATQLVNEKSYFNKLMVCEITEKFCVDNHITIGTTKLLLSNLNRPFTALLADAWLLDKQKRNIILQDAKRFNTIYKYSPRRYQRYLYFLEKIIGIKGVSWILHQRACYVRKKINRGFK